MTINCSIGSFYLSNICFGETAAEDSFCNHESVEAVEQIADKHTNLMDFDEQVHFRWGDAVFLKNANVW